MTISTKTLAISIVLSLVAGFIAAKTISKPEVRIETKQEIVEKIIIQEKIVEKIVKDIQIVQGPIKTVIVEKRPDGTTIETKIDNTGSTTVDKTKTDTVKTVDTKSETVTKTETIQSPQKNWLIGLDIEYPVAKVFKSDYLSPKIDLNARYRIFKDVYVGGTTGFSFDSKQVTIGLGFQVGM